MIRSIKSKEELLSLRGTDPLFTRIYGDYCCSEKLDFSDGAMYWTDGNSLIAELKNGAITICGEITDTYELEDFISFIHPELIMFSYNHLDFFGNDYRNSGIIMSKRAEGELADPLINNDFRMKDYYEFFENCGLASNYEGFMLGMSDFIKTGTGFLTGEYNGSELISAAAVTGITDVSAIITSIGVDESHRREHLGTLLMQELMDNLSGREIIIYREILKNEEFYKSLGFENIGKFYTV
ncbi:MAG: GNAT family N-acetyltransferase [Clostridia bacterium]|nr:GNAT family N-acetyltransferase [Clostridia bacterium]